MTSKGRVLRTGAYVVADLTVFAFGFYFLKIRELGLYFFLMIIGAPASCAVVPVSEMVAPRFGLDLGRAPHAWLTAAASALTNALLAWGLAGLIVRLTRR